MKNQTAALCFPLNRIPELAIALFLIFLFGLWPQSALHAQSSLKVGDPRTSWLTSQGTIEAATISLKPLGAYWEVGLYLTFSARGTQWYNKPDSLEIVYRFDLPANAIVHDSWLWIGDNIIKAKILDRWTASAIYEGYVKRRTDPSILYKNSSTQYELRVFPMAGNQTRRVKLSYLLPAQWTRERVQASLPVALLKLSRYAPKLTVLAWANEHGKNPTLSAGTAFNTFSLEHPTLYQANFSGWPPNDLSVGFDTPLPKGYRVSTLQQGDEGFYQLMFLPGSLTSTPYKRKIALLIDYDASGGATTPQQLLSAAQTALLQNLSPSDSFNLIFSNFTVKRASDNWLPADAATIEGVFKSWQNPLSTYSNMTPLLSNGIDFIKQNGGKGQLMLITNASQVSTASAANTLLNDILGQVPNGVPIHVIDYYTNNQISQNVGGVTYFGNGYFLGILAAQTKGAYSSLRSSTLPAVFSKSFGNLSPNIEAFDFHTTLANGFCYGRFYTAGDGDVAYLDRPIVQIGKYKGTFPFKIQVSGEYNDQVFNGEIEVPESEIIAGDSLMREMWYGEYMRLLEAETQQNSIIQEILAASLRERVLSRYTAFLCPEDLSLVCPTCLDETELTGVEPEALRDSTLSAFPNPFAESVQIKVKNTALSGQKGSLEIMAVDGRLVQAFEINLSNGETLLRWDGKSVDGRTAPAGVYLAILKTGAAARVLKLVKQS